MKKIRITVLLVMALVLMSMSFAGCSENVTETKSTSTPTIEESTSTPTIEESTSAPTFEGKDPSELTIAFLSGLTNEFHQLQVAGVQAACEDYGVNFVTQASGDAQGRLNIVNTYIGQGVDGIISYITASAIEVYRPAFDAGILVGSTGYFEGNDFTAACYGTTEEALGIEIGAVTAQLITEKLDGKAKIHVIRLYKGSDCDARTTGLLKKLTEEIGESAFEVVSESSSYDVDTAMQQVRDAMSANPDINLIFCEASPASQGAVSALEQLDLQDKVYVITSAGDSVHAEMVLAEGNPLFALDLTQPYADGYNCAEKIIKILLTGETDYTLGEFVKTELIVMSKFDMEGAQAAYDEYAAQLTSIQ